MNRLDRYIDRLDEDKNEEQLNREIERCEQTKIDR